MDFGLVGTFKTLLNGVELTPLISPVDSVKASPVAGRPGPNTHQMSKRRIRSFRIYPDNGEVYFQVLIYPSTKSFENANQEHVGCAGVCTSIDHILIARDGTETLGPNIGRVQIKRIRCRSSIVAHELTHATIAYFRWRKENQYHIVYGRKKSHLVPDREECFCRVLSNLVVQFWNRFYRDKGKACHKFEWNPVELKNGGKPREDQRNRPAITI